MRGRGGGGGGADHRDGGRGLAHVGLEAGDQFGAPEGLGQEVVGARVQAPGDGRLVGPAGEEHDRHQGILRAQLAADVDARTVGEAPVDDHAHRAAVGRRGKTLGRAPADDGHESLVGERVRQQLPLVG